jgi:transcriptional regulator with PAS, ATPase and Fis domain
MSETATMRKLIHKTEERKAALELAEARLVECIQLVPQLRTEGYSMEVIANQLGVTRQTVYERCKA